MYESRLTEQVQRPAHCPFCKSKIIGTFAKVITVNAFWRCRECDKTWTIAGRSATPRAL